MIILSNNLWNCDSNCAPWREKGEDCSADARVDGLFKAYAAVLPDILGFQEMSRHMENLLFSRMRRMKDVEGNQVQYEMITGGYTPILFRFDKFRLLRSGYYAFPTAFPPYEGCFNDADSKGYSYGVFERRADGKRVIVFSTHLWWMSADPSNKDFQAGSDLARAAQIRMAAKEAKALAAEYDCPVILMGDLNDVLGSPCLNAAKKCGFEETHEKCVGERDDRRGYHYCFPSGWRHDPDGVYENAIDHILIYNEGSVVVKRFKRFMEPFFEPLSDHFPVYIELEV